MLVTLNRELGLWDTTLWFLFPSEKCPSFQLGGIYTFFFEGFLKKKKQTTVREINTIFVNSWQNNMGFSLNE